MEVIVLLLVAGVILTRKLEKTEIPVYLEGLYYKHSQLTGVPAMLLKAIAQVESSENPAAVNPADPSYGLMQLLCQVDPTGNRACKNTLFVQDWPPKSKEQLYDPDYSLLIASQIMKSNIAAYGLPKAIAVYNSWSARNDPANGPFKNQVYVDRVLSAWKALDPGRA